MTDQPSNTPNPPSSGDDQNDQNDQEARPEEITPSQSRQQSAPQLASGPGQTQAGDVRDVKTDMTPALSLQGEDGRVSTIHYTLHYIGRNLDSGPRGAIVLLHDLPGGAWTWQDTLAPLAATGRAVYAFDLLGYGASDKPWPSDTSIWGHGDALAYAFAALGLTEIVLVGVGLGGAVAQVLATRLYRQHVARLILLGSYGYEYAFAPDWPLPEMVKRQDPEAPRHSPLDQVLADLRATLPQGSANPKHLHGSKLDAYVNPWNSHVGSELLFQHIRLLLPSYMNAVSSNLRHLEIPVLLVWGETDTITPITLGERMAREIPGARLEHVAGAGHLILDDAPDTVGKLIADFAAAPTTTQLASSR